MEPVVFMPAMLAGHMAKHCNHMVNSPDENNNTGGVYKGNFSVSSQIIGILSVNQIWNQSITWLFGCVLESDHRTDPSEKKSVLWD